MSKAVLSRRDFLMDAASARNTTDEGIWYALRDDKNYTSCYIPAQHMQPPGAYWQRLWLSAQLWLHQSDSSDRQMALPLDYTQRVPNKEMTYG